MVLKGPDKKKHSILMRPKFMADLVERFSAIQVREPVHPHDDGIDHVPDQSRGPRWGGANFRQGEGQNVFE